MNNVKGLKEYGYVYKSMNNTKYINQLMIKIDVTLFRYKLQNNINTHRIFTNIKICLMILKVFKYFVSYWIIFKKVGFLDMFILK